MKEPDRYCRTRVSKALLLLLLAWISASCLKEMPKSLPERFEWDPELAFPLGEKQFGMNQESGFDTALFQVFDTLTGLPGWVFTTELLFEGTVDFNLASFSENTDHLNRLLLRIQIENGFPQEFLTQGYFRVSGLEVDSVFPGGPVLLGPGTPVKGGETIRPYTILHDIVFSRERLVALQDVTGILFRVLIMNVQLDTAHIPYYPTYHFDVGMGAMIDLDLEF